MKIDNDELVLGNLLDEVKRVCEDPRAIRFLQELMEFEKGYSYSYLDEIRKMLAKYVGHDE